MDADGERAASDSRCGCWVAIATWFGNAGTSGVAPISVVPRYLRQVTVSDQDKADIHTGMTRCSRFLHSQPAAGGMPLPDKMELAADLAALESFVDRKNKESEGK